MIDKAVATPAWPRVGVVRLTSLRQRVYYNEHGSGRCATRMVWTLCLRRAWCSHGVHMVLTLCLCQQRHAHCACAPEEGPPHDTFPWRPSITPTPSGHSEDVCPRKTDFWSRKFITEPHAWASLPRPPHPPRCCVPCGPGGRSHRASLSKNCKHFAGKNLKAPSWTACRHLEHARASFCRRRRRRPLLLRRPRSFCRRRRPPSPRAPR